MIQELSGKPEAPRVPRPDSERPLSKLPEWIKVLPLGTVKFLDHREPFIVDEASLMSIATEFRHRGVDLVIDYEHQSLQGERAPAAGWIKELEARGDGLWARVDWTQQARDYLGKREYRYFSPVLRLDPETRRPVALMCLGLTNEPVLKRSGFFPAFTAFPPPIGDLLAGTNAADPRHENAAGKRHCALCAFKMTGQWACGNASRFKCPSPKGTGKCPGFLAKPTRSRPPKTKKKSLPVPEGVKFLYIGAPKGKTKKGVPQHQGVVTVAWITPAPGVLHLGFSFCSPEDPWCKATGRDMAAARLLTTIAVPFLYDAKRAVREVVRAVLSHDFERLEALCGPGTKAWGHHRVPSWTKGLVNVMKGGARRKSLSDLMVERNNRMVKERQARFRAADALNKPTAQQIVARMMRDIAALGND